jgi:hypothetical protein
VLAVQDRSCDRRLVPKCDGSGQSLTPLLIASHRPQTLVTFHGGMAAIGYEWGSMQHLRGRDKCPDHLAHSAIAKAFVSFAGGFKGEPPYRAAPISSIVYPVDGGMEVSPLPPSPSIALTLATRIGRMPLVGTSS